MSDLLLSYIIPVYNTALHVRKCLQSILDQGLEPDAFEILVVDDGSTDGSRAVVEEFAANHPQVRLLCQDNAGVSAARNLALDQAAGRYVQFVDSDDYLVAGVMPALLQHAVADDLDVLQFNYCRVDEQGAPVTDFRDDSNPATAVSTGADFLANHSMTPYVWRFLVRREYLDGRGLRFNTSLIVCEDGALIADFLLHAPRMAHDEATAYCYVQRGDSAMHNTTDRAYLTRRVFSQVDSAASIQNTITEYERLTGRQAPASVAGLRNVYLYFSMTKALTCGIVDEVLDRISKAGLYPFPCVGPEAHYEGIKWKIIHRLMMHPRLWAWLSVVYRKIKQ